MGPGQWLEEHQQRVSSTSEALEFFDTLPAVQLPEMRGRWKGSGLPTDHPMDGLLEALRWYGKEFVDDDHVHPLLFCGRGGRLVVLSPARIPIQLAMRAAPGAVKQAPRSLLGWTFPLARPWLATRRFGARLRMTEFRGVSSATMIYDQLPIHDIFRRVDDQTVLGLMDMRGMDQPFFFVLRHDTR
jgi:hypothetical protein